MKYLGRDKAIKTTISGLKLGHESGQLTVVDADQQPYLTDGNRIVVGRSLENSELMDLVVEKGVRHVVQMPNQDFARQVCFTANILTNPEKFFEDPRHYLTGMGHQSLLEGDIGLFHYPLASPMTGKETLLDRIHADLNKIPRSNTIRDSALLVADEMIMNVTKDAPLYFAQNFPDAPKRDRSSSLYIAFDQDRLLLWTEDDFGSLAVDKMIARLRDCYAAEQINPLMAEGQGAGLGCKMIFDMSVSMSVLVKPGVKTVFCAVLPLGMSNRKIQGLPKNLQILALTF
ncbi:MAG: hypothetical protein AB7N80_13745 [Bdellovibrionales bacterium]